MIQNPINAPEEPGIYCIIENDELIYCGQSKNVKRRLGQHALSNNQETLTYIIKESDRDTRKEMEEFLIANFDPKYNKQKQLSYIRHEDITEGVIEFFSDFKVPKKLKMKPWFSKTISQVKEVQS